MRFGERFGQALGVVALGVLASTTAIGQVTTRLVTAGGVATSTKIAPGGTASIDVRVDAPGTATIGTVFRLSQSAPVVNGFFSITARSFVGSPYNDPASGTPDGVVLAPSSALLDPDNDDNLGHSTTDLVATPGASNILVANLSLTASAATPLGTYTLKPAAGVSFVTGTGPAFTDYDMSGATYTIIVSPMPEPCRLDVDGNGAPADVATDIVYLTRRLLGLAPVPTSFRTGDAAIATDALISARIDALGTALDVDMNGSVDAATDMVYIARRLLRLLSVPTSFRSLDPVIASDATIAARIDALCP